MADSPRDGKIRYSFVVDKPERFGQEAYVLARSLIELASVSADDISAHLVRGTSRSVGKQLADLGVRTFLVEPFGHPYCNRLQQLPRLLNDDSENFVLLDTDMFAVRPLVLEPSNAIRAKPVDAPNPPIPVLREIFTTAGLHLEIASTDVIVAETAQANFNAGLFMIPRTHLALVTEAWTRWARWSLNRLELYRKWTDNVDQVSFAMAASELNLPTVGLPRHYNAPIHLGPVDVAETPIFLHYHRHLDASRMLRLNGGPKVDAAIRVANRSIARWRESNSTVPVAMTPCVAPAHRVTANNDRPLVTVVVPTYKPGARFRACIAALVDQTYPNVLIRVSVDRSSDDGAIELPDLKGRSVEIVRQVKRLGWVGNVNALLATVTSPYFALTMHDDQLSSRYLESAVEILESRPRVVSAHGSVRHHGIRDGQIESTPSINGSQVARLHEFLDRRPHLAEQCFRGVIRADLVRRGLRLRVRRSDGQFANTLMALEIVAHGETAFMADAYYDKFTDAGGLSREFHQRSTEQKAEMLADNLACALDVLVDAGVPPQQHAILLARYAEWLLGLRGSWNIVGEVQSSDEEPYAAVRPALARFVAHAVLSAATPRAEFASGPTPVRRLLRLMRRMAPARSERDANQRVRAS